MALPRLSVVALLLPIVLGGCSGSPPPQPARIDPRPEVIDPVHRVATELRSAQEVGMNRRRFGELLEKFATELALGREKAESPREKQVLDGYADVLGIYKDAARVWDVKIRVPEIKDLADQQAQAAVGGGSTSLLIPNMQFQEAIAEAIPLTLFRPGSTGIDDLVARYQLPVTDTKGWKTVPNDSVERIWAKARARTEEVAGGRKG